MEICVEPTCCTGDSARYIDLLGVETVIYDPFLFGQGWPEGRRIYRLESFVCIGLRLRYLIAPSGMVD